VLLFLGRGGGFSRIFGGLGLTDCIATKY
jgi:hypothetical protein